jgi:CBS domain-containing protein
MASKPVKKEESDSTQRARREPTRARQGPDPDAPPPRAEGTMSDPDFRTSAEFRPAPSAERSARQVQVSQVMSREVEVIRPDNTLEEAAEKMKRFDVGPLPVCEADRLVVGMITDRDIIMRSVAQGEDPSRDLVRDVMTTEVIACFEDQDLAVAARLMQDKEIRQLPVLDRNRRLVGIVSLGDLARATQNY